MDDDKVAELRAIADRLWELGMADIAYELDTAIDVHEAILEEDRVEESES